MPINIHFSLKKSFMEEEKQPYFSIDFQVDFSPSEWFDLFLHEQEWIM